MIESLRSTFSSILGRLYSPSSIRLLACCSNSRHVEAFSPFCSCTPASSRATLASSALLLAMFIAQYCSILDCFAAPCSCFRMFPYSGSPFHVIT